MTPWGTDSPELRVPGVRASWLPVDSDDPADVPEVAGARALGFEPAHEAPLWCFLPAVWPEHARAWVRDTRVRHATISCDGEPTRRVPWSTWDYADIEADVNLLLAECGLPARPFGRLWLLRPPPGFGALDDALEHLARHAEAAGEPIMASAGFVAVVAPEVRRLFDI